MRSVEAIDNSRDSLKDDGVQIILLVDDEEMFLSSLSDALRDDLRDNFRILTAENGEEALTILSCHRVDLVVTDLRMPVMDGFRLVSRMKEEHFKIPVIAMSAWISSEQEEVLQALGISRYIEKPFSLDALIGLIAAELSEVTGRPALVVID